MSEGHSLSKAAVWVFLGFIVPSLVIVLAGGAGQDSAKCLQGLLISGSLVVALAIGAKIAAYREDNDRRK